MVDSGGGLGIITLTVRQVIGVNALPDRQIQTRLVCGSDDLIVTLEAEQARQLADGLQKAIESLEQDAP